MREPPLAALRQLRFVLEAYAGMPLPEWPVLASRATEARVPVGADLYATETPGDGFAYFVVRGLIKLQERTPADEPARILSFAGQNELIASLGSLRPHALKRPAELGLARSRWLRGQQVMGFPPDSAIALEDSRLIRLTVATLDDLATRHPAWALMFANYFFAQLADAHVDYYETRFLTPEQRYRSLLSANPSLSDRLTQRDLAAYLGVTPAGLCRMAARVRREDPPLGLSRAGRRTARSTGSARRSRG